MACHNVHGHIAEGLRTLKAGSLRPEVQHDP